MTGKGGGTAAHSVFWKCLLNAREGSRDLSILLLGEEHRDLYPPLHRVVTLPTFPGVCHALTGGRGQREQTSLCPRNKLQTTLCDPQVQGHHQGPQDMVFKRREPGQSKNGSSPNSKSRPSPDPLQGPPHTHSQALMTNAALLRSGSNMPNKPEFKKKCLVAEKAPLPSPRTCK